MSVNKKIIFFTYFLFIVFSMPVAAQKSKAELENEKKENERKIKEAERILTETASERKVTLGQLSALNQQIEASESLIKSYNNEIGLLNDEIADINAIVKSLEQDLDNLKKEYAAMVYAASKASRGYNKLTFIFSSETFNQLLMRLQYMKQYAESRKNQVEQIEKVKEALSVQRANMEEKKAEKNALLSQQIRQSQKLLTLKNKQNTFIQNLNKREKELKRELASRKKAINKLDKLIADIVKREIERSTKGKSSSKMALTPEAAMISSSFEGNKTRLLWPVESGFISGQYGKHAHPVLKGIMVENQGIDIQTNKNEIVRSVFDGEVKTVAIVPGMNNVVIIQHGEYFTLYARLKNVSVKQGQQVKVKDPVGEVYTDKDGVSEVQFQIWKNNQKLNPQAWLYTK